MPTIDELEDHQIETLINLVISNTKESYREFMQQVGIPVGVNKEIQQERLTTKLYDREVSIEQIVDLLDDIEEYGNQHIFLYDVLPVDLEDFASEDYVRGLLEDYGIPERYDGRAALILPNEPEVSTVHHNENELVIKWVHAKTRRRRIDTEREGNIEVVRYALDTIRGINLFRLNLQTGTAELLIRSESNTDSKYVQQREEFEGLVEDLLGINTFPALDISQAIDTLARHIAQAEGEVEDEDEPEILRRGGKCNTALGSGTNFTSPDKATDYLDDETVAAFICNEELVITVANLYWQPNGDELTREVHAKLYSEMSKVFISGQKSREEIDYVLQRIRYYCES